MLQCLHMFTHILTGSLLFLLVLYTNFVISIDNLAIQFMWICAHKYNENVVGTDWSNGEVAGLYWIKTHTLSIFVFSFMQHCAERVAYDIKIPWEWLKSTAFEL